MGKIIKAKNDNIEQRMQKIKKKINNFLLKYFNWFVLVVALIVLFLGYFLIIQHKYIQVIEDVEMASNDKEGEYLIYQQYLTKLKELKAIYQKVKKEDKDKLEIILPNEANIEELFSKMEAIISKNGLILTSLQIEPENKIRTKNKKKNSEDKKGETNDIFGNIGKVKITMSITGVDYNGLKKLLRILESNLRLIDVETVNFSPDKNQASLKLLTYYMK